MQKCGKKVCSNVEKVFNYPLYIRLVIKSIFLFDHFAGVFSFYSIKIVNQVVIVMEKPRDSFCFFRLDVRFEEFQIWVEFYSIEIFEKMNSQAVSSI